MNELVKDTTDIVKTEVKGGIRQWAIKHEAALWTTGGIIFDGLAIAYALKDSYKILNAIDICNKMLKDESDPKKRKDIIKQTAKDIAVPVTRIAGFYAAGSACHIINTKRMTKKIADLTGALSLTTAALTQAKVWNEQAHKELERDKLWQEEAKKKMGEEKTSEVEKEVAKKEVEKDPPKENVSEDEPKDMFHYYISNTEAWKWSDKSPSDIKGWCYDRGYDLVNGNFSGDALGFNEFLRWLTENSPDGVYQIQGAEHNKDWYWRAADGRGQFPSDLVDIQVTSAIGKDEKPHLVIHCNFIPDMYSFRG